MNSYLCYVLYFAFANFHAFAEGHIEDVGLTETATPSWDNHSSCVQAILDYTAYQQYDDKSHVKITHLCRSLLSGELDDQLYRRAFELASTLEECALTDNHHITAEVLLTNYCHFLNDGEAWMSAHIGQSGLGVPTKEKPQVPSIDMARVTEPVDFKHALGKCQPSLCTLSVLDDLEWLAVISLGYTSKSHLCFPRNTMPDVLLREAEIRARACENTNGICSIIAILQSYCSSDPETFRTGLESTSTICTTTTTATLTEIVANVATSIPPLYILKNKVALASQDYSCSSISAMFKIFLIQAGPVICLANLAAYAIQALGWNFMMYHSNRTNYAGVMAFHGEKIALSLADFMKPGPNLNRKFYYRAYLLSCLLAVATYCFVIWFMLTQTRRGPYLNVGLFAGSVNWLVQAAGFWVIERMLRNLDEQLSSAERGEDAGA